MSFDPCFNNGGIDGFSNIIYGAQFQSFDHMLGLIQSRKENNRNMLSSGVCLETFADFQTGRESDAEGKGVVSRRGHVGH